MRLNELPPGLLAVIKEVKESDNEIRLNDLGFVAGVQIQCWMESPLKDPRMYRLLGTSVALRNEDAAKIIVGLMDHA